MKIKKSDQLKLRTLLKLFFLCLVLFILLFFYLFWSLSTVNEDGSNSVITEPVTFKRWELHAHIGSYRFIYQKFYTLFQVENKITSFFRHDVVIAVVACGDRFEETMMMLKSALMFTEIHLNFLIVSDDNLIERFKEKVRACYCS